MNPYYQIDEKPRTHRTGMIAVIVAVVLVVLAVAMLMLLLPSERRSEPTETTETGAWGHEPSGESGADGREPGEGTDGFSSVPKPEDWRTVKYYAPDEVALWVDDVYQGLKAVAEARWDVLEPGGAQVGLFDFKCDGKPEIVLLYLGDPDADVKTGYRMEVFDLMGVHITTYVWDEYAEFSFVVRASAGQVYPCMASLNESVSVIFMGDPSRSYSGEALYRLEGYDMHPVYRSHTQGETMTFTYGDEVMELGPWNRLVNAFEEENPGLYSTSMEIHLWGAETNLYELAQLLVHSDQRFVMPEWEAYPAVDE